MSTCNAHYISLKPWKIEQVYGQSQWHLHSACSGSIINFLLILVLFVHNGVKSPIFYGYKNQDPWIFKIWVFETEQFFAQVHLSNDKQRMWYSKTRVAGRTLEYWNYYESLHFWFHWSQITWERRKIFFHSFPSNLRPMASKVKALMMIPVL